jgi:hypothetical protein
VTNEPEEITLIVYYFKNISSKNTCDFVHNFFLEECKVQGTMLGNEDYLKFATLVSYSLFFLGLFIYLIPNGNIFFKKIAWKHRIVGLTHLVVLLFGLVNIFTRRVNYLVYDIVLGVSGTILTLTAAKDFESHKHIQNVASGSLDPDATITYAEMMEHSFYQVLNLIQILFIHSFELQFESLPLRYYSFLSFSYCFLRMVLRMPSHVS